MSISINKVFYSSIGIAVIVCFTTIAFIGFHWKEIMIPSVSINTNTITRIDETRFYNGLQTGHNRILRPNKRVYYSRNDSRVPLRIREQIGNAFDEALRIFPISWPIQQPDIVFASGETEGGMPHTFDNRVIVPLVEDMGLDSIKETMIHELCHVHQRQDPDSWSELYRRLGFQKLTIQDDVSSILQTQDVVANPDAGSLGMPQIGWWKYMGQLGVLVFQQGASSLRDYQSVVIPVELSNTRDPGINQLRERFGKLCHQYDHPNEITACLISEHWDKVVRPNDIHDKTDPRRIVCDWLREKTLSSNQ